MPGAICLVHVGQSDGAVEHPGAAGQVDRCRECAEHALGRHHRVGARWDQHAERIAVEPNHM